ncbi:MAG: polyprenyl diphosphate synthase [Gammaproteobacteria bacterium]|nr:polyprenyl diphosphate synthase [Gammaproteobacteria bacterium]MDD9896737.1 polyprenyl diphosphate synthase [Gammaproteobacteria bacterium]MDD9957764.1 polyprenyl diphosphate synthase [Gammaproteobacteria bacterium]
MTPDPTGNLPQHIAIIMDGNNRWARANGLAAKSGHRYGAEAALKIVNSCVRRGINYLTLFAFSSENWMRPTKEVQGLMALFLTVLKRKEINQLHKNNVRLQFIGNRIEFSSKLKETMSEVEELTQHNTGTTVIVAADYGGRWDVTNATKIIAEKVKQGEIDSDDISIEMVHSFTSLSEYPDPDLCIRTGGERRISNFLLWQFAYTELYFTDCYWPDFDEAQLQLALDDFASRQRRYGGHENAREVQ